jgi:CBS domain-containing protein
VNTTPRSKAFYFEFKQGPTPANRRQAGVPSAAAALGWRVAADQSGVEPPHSKNDASLHRGTALHGVKRLAARSVGYRMPSRKSELLTSELLTSDICLMNCPSCGHENIEGNDRCENCLAPFRDLDVPRIDSAEGLARSVMEDNLKELVQDQTISVTPDTPALEVARLMKNSNSGCALVVDGGKLVGIFTEHDVLLRMTGESSATKAQFVEPMIVERTGDATNEAGALVEEMQLVGMPSAEVPLEEMRADAVQVAKTSTSKISASEQSVPVKNLMTSNPEILRETDSVAEALNKMSLGRYRHIPYLKSDGTHAVASIKSVLKYIAQEDW